ncbi:MAG: hypothetical protein DBX48_02385 [Limosilactobacillus fermentum]|nr:MAG: hypothetical protein DBX48_02385 [Limosilactobacillus fermentum]
MYTRAEVERQIKTKKSWTGKQVAKVLLSNFFISARTGKNIITNEEITYIQNHPRNDIEAQKIYSFSQLYISLMDIYNILESYTAQANSSVALLSTSLKVHFRMLQFREYQLNTPLMITETQEKQYLKNYQEYLEERVRRNFTKTETWLSFLMKRDAFFIENIDFIPEFPDEDEYSHSEKTAMIISQYKVTKIKDIDFAKRLSERLFAKGIMDPNLAMTNYQRVFGPAPLQYTAAIAKQYRYHNKEKALFHYGQKVLKEIYKLLYYHQEHFSFDEALKKALAKYPVNFPEGTPQPMPNDITKYDFLTKVIIPGHVKKGLWNWQTQELNDFLINEYGDYLNSAKQDAIAEHPKLKVLFDTAKKPLNTLGTWGMLYNSGVEEYNPKPSKDSYKYGKWRGFPKDVRSRVRDYGYSVYHNAGAINNFENFVESNDPVLSDLAQVKTNKAMRQRKQAYDQIRQYLIIHQAYVALVRGIKAWTGFADANKLVNISNGYSTFLREAREYNDLIYLEFAGLRGIMKGKAKELQKAIELLDVYTPLDLEEKIIPHSTNKALIEFLEETFQPGSPRNASMIINSVANGLKAGGDD